MPEPDDLYPMMPLVRPVYLNPERPVLSPASTPTVIQSHGVPPATVMLLPGSMFEDGRKRAVVSDRMPPYDVAHVEAWMLDQESIARTISKVLSIIGTGEVSQTEEGAPKPNTTVVEATRPVGCYCCGRPGASTRVSSGRMHFDCWEEHHSDPTTEWPVGHRCKGDTDA